MIKLSNSLAVAGLSLLSLTACNTLPTIQSITPQQLDYGKPATLQLKLDGEIKDAQLALRPDNITRRDYPLIQPVSDLLVLNNGLQLLAQGQTLLLQGEQGVVAQLTLPNLINHIALGDNVILASDTAKQLYRITILHNQMDIDQQWPLSHPVDFLSASVAASRDGEISLLQGIQPRTYTLEKRFSAIDCLDHYCYLATEKGVQVTALNNDGTSQPLTRFTVAGAVSDLVLQSQRLYLAGKMGFTIVDISLPDQPRWLASNNKFGPATELKVGEFFTLLRDNLGRYHVIDTSMAKQPVWQASFNGPIDGPFAVHQTEAWLTDGLILQQANIADAELPISNHSGINLGGSRRVQLRDNTLYVADWFSGLHLYDISDAQAPRHIGNVHTPGSAKGVWLDGDYAYVGDDDHGLQVVNLNTMQVVHEVPTHGLAYTMDRVDNLLYLADHRGGFQLIDISEPEKAYSVGLHDTPQKVWSIQAYKHYALVTDDQTGVLVFDVSDPSQPRQVAQYQPGGFAEDIVVRGDIAYVAFFDDGLHILDISNPLAPKPLGYLPTPGNARGIYLVDNLLYLADWYAGLQVIDIQDPHLPQWLGGLDTQGAAWGVVVQNDTAYVMDWWGGIQTVDVADPRHPVLRHSFHAQQNLQDIALNGGFAYLAAGSGGLQVFDVNNSQGPIWTTALDLSGSSQQLMIGADRAYVAHHPGGITVVDISNPFYAKALQHIPLSQSLKQLSLLDQLLLALDEQDHLHAWQVDTQGHLQPVETAIDSHQLTALGESDSWPVVINEEGAIELLDSQSLLPISALPGDFQQVLLRNDTLYAIGNDQLLIAILHDSHIQPLSRWVLDESVMDMQLKAEMLYLSGEQEVLALDVSQPEQPALRYRYPRTNLPGAIAIGKDAIFSAGDRWLSTAPQLPALQQKSTDEGVALEIDEGLPMGSYDLLLHNAAGVEDNQSNAIQVRMPKGKKVNFTMEDLKRLIKEQQQLPTTP